MQRVYEFLQAYYDGKSPLLLGYSGGPDSKALLYALIECGIGNLHLAHIDHGWRETSRSEADELRKEAENLHCPFHSIRLSLPIDGNKEDAARRARLQFFHSLFSQIPFQALLLAHHEKDLAETVLKRIFEGAHLPFLSGMEPVGSHQGMAIWRPLLSVKKREIEGFLEKRELIPIHDPTNLDPKFLRARMRKEIFPYLNEAFGKEIDENLALISQRGAELKEYLDRKVEPAWERALRGPWGLLIETDGLERIEKRHLVQKAAATESLSLPRTILESLLDGLENRLSNRRFKIRTREILIDQGMVFFLAERFPSVEDWHIKSVFADAPIAHLSFPDWKEVWKGSFTWFFPNNRQRHKNRVPSFFKKEIAGINKFLSEKEKMGEQGGLEFSFSFASKLSGSSE